MKPSKNYSWEVQSRLPYLSYAEFQSKKVATFWNFWFPWRMEWMCDWCSFRRPCSDDSRGRRAQRQSATRRWQMQTTCRWSSSQTSISSSAISHRPGSWKCPIWRFVAKSIYFSKTVRINFDASKANNFHIVFILILFYDVSFSTMSENMCVSVCVFAYCKLKHFNSPVDIGDVAWQRSLEQHYSHHAWRQPAFVRA